MHAIIPKGNIGYDQYTVPDDCSCRTYFCCFPLALANTFPWPFVPILSNFFEKKRTQNHPQCLSGLSRALFPTTFLEIAGNPKCGEVAGPDQRAAKQMRPGTVQINHSLPKVNLSFSREKIRENVLILRFIPVLKIVHLQQLKGMQVLN